MQTSDSIKNGQRCPQCSVGTTVDRKGLGFVRHKQKPPVGSACAIKAYGVHEKD